MKTYLEIYNPEKTYLYPDKSIATPERIQSEWVAVNVATCVIGTNSSHTTFTSIELLDDMRDRFNIDPALSDSAALIALEEAVNIPPAVNTEPTAEERIAAALEFQNILAMPIE